MVVGLLEVCFVRYIELIARSGDVSAVTHACKRKPPGMRVTSLDGMECLTTKQRQMCPIKVLYRRNTNPLKH